MRGSAALAAPSNPAFTAAPNVERDEPYQVNRGGQIERAPANEPVACTMKPVAATPIIPGRVAKVFEIPIRIPA